MNKRVVKKILMILLSITIVTGFFEGMSFETAKAEPLLQKGITIETTKQRFAVTESFLEKEVAKGYSLRQIYNGLLKSEHQNIDYSISMQRLFPKEVNISQTVEGEAHNTNILEHALLMNTDEKLKDSAQELEDIPATDSVEHENSQMEKDELVTPEGETHFNGLTTFANEPAVPEEPPVYTKSNISQAPYQVGIINEIVSTLSGDLSLEHTDMALPGRNGLGFELTRQYQSADANLFDITHKVETYPETLYAYYVAYNAIQKQIVYDVTYKETLSVEERGRDYLFGLESEVKTYATYTSKEEADNKVREGIYYTSSPSSRNETTSRTSSSNSFPSSVSYSQDGYSGTLYKQGSSTVISGAYTPAHSKEQTLSCERKKYGKYNAQGVWIKTSEDPECPSTKSYNSGGYSGTLSRTPTQPIKTCPTTGPPNTNCTGHWKVDYKGTVSKPASDTRVYQQNYSGTVTKPGSKDTRRYEAWQEGGSWRYVYEISNVKADRRETKPVEIPARTIPYLNYSDAVAERDFINASPDKEIEKENGYIYHYSSSPNATIKPEYVGMTTGYRYVNDTKQQLIESKFPIGKGWSWKIPYLEKEGGKIYLHPAEGGSYEIEGTTVKDYPWLGLKFVNDNSVVVNSETSSYVLSNVDEAVKQYFTNDGRLLQIKDSYNNTIDFYYSSSTTYGQKLLEEIKDSIGNTISITYSTTEVTVTNGTDTVTYKKGVENGKELLTSVIDPEGRKTSYTYNISPAKFNLLGHDESRAKANPYALLEKIQHPTGAITEYTYEAAPVKRFIGSSSYQESYRVASRIDKLLYEDDSQQTSNYKVFQYTGDYAQSYGQSLTFSTSIMDGLTSSEFHYKKEVNQTNQPAHYYLVSQKNSAQDLENIIQYNYDKKVTGRNYAVSSPTKTEVSNNLTTDTLVTEMQYDDYGNITMQKDPTGKTIENVYDSTKKWLVHSKEKIDQQNFLYTEFTRNQQGSIVKTVVNKQDSNGELLKEVEVEDIDLYGNITKLKTKNGNKSQTYEIEYDQIHHAFPTLQKINVTNIDGIVETISSSYDYDVATGQLKQYTDGNGHVTVFQYDKLGRVIQVTQADSTQLTSNYDDLNNIVMVTDELNRQYKTVWNGLGFKVEEGIIGSTGYMKQAELGYDEYGRNIWGEDAVGNRTAYEFDNWSRLTKSTLPNGAVSWVTYDDLNRSSTATDAEGNKVTEKFDKFGRSIEVLEHLDASTTQIIGKTEYEPISGLVTSQKDANQHETLFTYDILGQLTSVQNALGEVTSYEYDQLGNHVKTIFPDSKEVSKVYDELGRLIEHIDPLNQREKMYYDAVGNRTKLVDRKGQQFHYSYDNRNNLLTKQGPTETIGFSYRADGTRASMHDATGTTQYSYDPFTGNIISVTFPDGKTMDYSYNQNHQRATMQTPFNDTVSYVYNSNNQLQELKLNNTSEITYEYLLNGQAWKELKQNGIQTERTYNNLSLESIDHSNMGGTFNQRYSYIYDLNKNITERKETKNSQVLEDSTFHYDLLNRIKTSSIFDESYQYDVRGNRQMLESSSDYYDNGNLSYEYDEWDRLKKVIKQDGSIITYKYNGDNLMVERSDSLSTIRYYYDGTHIIAEGMVNVDGTVSEKNSYIYGNKCLLHNKSAENCSVKMLK